MIDLDKYEEAIVFKQELECGGVIAVGRDDLLHIIDRLRQAEKDAARYRWLRDNCTTQQADAMGPTFVMTIRRKDNLFNVGLSIDEAMQRNGDNK